VRSADSNAAAQAAAGPPIPLQPSAPPPVTHHYQQQIVSQASMSQHNSQYRQSMSHQQVIQQVQPQLVVALPPEPQLPVGYRSSQVLSGHQYLAEPPPPYPGHSMNGSVPGLPPPLPPPRPTASMSGLGAGPTHGYGEGRGHYNRRAHRGQVSSAPNTSQQLPRSHYVDK